MDYTGFNPRTHTWLYNGHTLPGGEPEYLEAVKNGTSEENTFLQSASVAYNKHLRVL